MKHLGANDPVVKSLLGGKPPQAAAEMYVSTSNLQDVDLRKRLVKDPKAVAASNDGMIRFARILDSRARELRRRYEDKVEAVMVPSASSLALARFAVHGESLYPDATFTFRVSYAPVKGYISNGKRVPWATTFEGLYQRATGVEPFQLPPRWKDAKSRLKLATPFNFVSTADTHGGNSGSPTVNTEGEIVGILFDGNLEGLPNRFVFTDVDARSVHVTSQAIVEALRSVYDAGTLLNELNQRN
jgi:hypothetical protein